MNDIAKSINRLDKWIESNSWAGYDPYDIKGTHLYLHLEKIKYIRDGLGFLVGSFPYASRKIFRVKKEFNSKAMALFARGYLKIYSESGNKAYFEKALFCLNWLIANSSTGYSGFCWGYPFDWQSRVFIPKNTPSEVVTSIAAHAFLDAYEITGDEKFLNVAKSCCEFILNDLNIDKLSDDKICFSYTPIDNYHVHNANLFSASVLLRTFKHTGNDLHKEMGIRSMNYTISFQNNDGSWYYWAPPDKLLHHIDNYHTGFVLECLNIGRRALGNEFKHTDSLKKGFEYYARNLFLDDGTPKITNKSVYPIDIHSSAQAIITFCELSDLMFEYKNMADKVAKWTIQNMQSSDGHFYYRIYKKRADHMPYIRWGQAWMLRALSYLYGDENEHT